MQLILFFLWLFSCNNYCNNYQRNETQPLLKIDTNKRFSNMIKYIKKDSIIKDIIYKYYPEINCFDFPETASPDTSFIPSNMMSVADYMFITNDTNKSSRYKYDLMKKIDSINSFKYKNQKFAIKNTNFKQIENCSSNYEFKVFFDSSNVWSIVIIPKEIKPGIWRMVYYIFVFDEKDNISRVRTSFAEE